MPHPEASLAEADPEDSASPDPLAGSQGQDNDESVSAPLAFRPLPEPRTVQAVPPSAEVPDPSIPVRSFIRRMAVSRPDRSVLDRANPGTLLALPLFEGVQARGVVVLNRPQNDQNPFAVSGEITEPFRGSFVLVDDPRLGWRGMILPSSGDRAFDLEEDEAGQLFLYEMPRGEVVCSPMPRHPEFVAAPSSLAPLPVIPSGGFRSAREQAAWLAALRAAPPPAAPAGLQRATGPVPVLRSRPGARGVLYLDFDGEVVTDPYWANGRTIRAAASEFSTAQMTDIWRIVAEDFTPFQVNVTTVEADYTSAPQGLRMRCIFTPTTDAAPPGRGSGLSWIFPLDRDDALLVFQRDRAVCRQCPRGEGRLHDRVPRAGAYF